MDLLINIDVPCLARGIEFYENAFGLTVTRRLGAEAAELSGWPARLYLLEKQAGSVGQKTARAITIDIGPRSTSTWWSTISRWR